MGRNRAPARFRPRVWDSGHTAGPFWPSGQNLRVWPLKRPNMAVLAVTARTLDQSPSEDPGFAGIPTLRTYPAERPGTGRSRTRWPTISTHPAPFIERGVHGIPEVPGPCKYSMLFDGIRGSGFGRNRSMEPRGSRAGLGFPAPWLWPFRAITGSSGLYGQNPRSNLLWGSETARYDVPKGRRNGAYAPLRGSPRGFI